MEVDKKPPFRDEWWFHLYELAYERYLYYLNCRKEHKSSGNWYCKKCSAKLIRMTGKGYIDGKELK